VDIDELIKLYNSELPETLRLLEACIISKKGSVASCEYFHDYEVGIGAESKSKIVWSMTDIAKRERFDDMPLVFYSLDGETLHMRLDDKKSIKKAFSGEKNSYLAYDIKRVKIWKKQGSSLVSFIKRVPPWFRLLNMGLMPESDSFFAKPSAMFVK